MTKGSRILAILVSLVLLALGVGAFIFTRPTVQIQLSDSRLHDIEVMDTQAGKYLFLARMYEGNTADGFQSPNLYVLDNGNLMPVLVYGSRHASAHFGESVTLQYGLPQHYTVVDSSVYNDITQVDAARFMPDGSIAFTLISHGFNMQNGLQENTDLYWIRDGAHEHEFMLHIATLITPASSPIGWNEVDHVPAFEAGLSIIG